MNHTIRILFVEDNSTDYQLALDVLRSEDVDFESFVVDNEKQLIHQLVQFHPDIVITDYYLPTLNGMKVIELMHSQAPDLPVIVLTGTTNDTIAVECLRAGAVDYLIKTNMLRLPFAVNEALDHARMLEHRNKAVADLEASEKKYRSFIEQSTDGIFVVNELGNYLEVNPSGCRMTGYTEEELLKMNVLDFNVDKEIRTEKTMFDELRVTGKGRLETRFRRKDGSIGWWIIQARKISDNLYVGYTNDITEERENEISLIHSEKKYKSLVDEMAQGLAVHEIIQNQAGEVVDYRFLDVNDSFVAMTGLSKSELIGKTVMEVMPETEKVWIECYGKVALTGESDSFESYTNALGRYYNVIAYRPQPQQFAIIVTDITKRKLDEEALQKSEEKYRLIAENSADVVFILDLEFNYVYLSPSVERLTGYSLEENLAHKADYNFTEGSKKRIMEIFLSELESQLINKPDPDRWIVFHGDILHKDNRIVNVELRVKFIYDQTGRVTGITGVTRNVTDQAIAEEALKNSEERYKLLFENSNDGIVVTNEKFMVFANRKMHAMIGLEHDLYTTEYASLIDPEDKQKVLESYYSLVISNIPIQKIQARFNLPTGESKWFELNAVNIVWDGKPAALSFLADITEQKRVSDSLREREEMLTAIASSVQDGICMVDADGNIVYWNKAAENIFGYTNDEIKDINLNELISPKSEDDSQLIFIDFIRKAEGKLVAENITEIAGKHKDGHSLELEVAMSTLNLNENWFAVGLLRDISSRNANQHLLVESEARFRMLFNNSPVGVLHIDSNGIILSMNDRLVKMFDFPLDKVIGLNVNTLPDKQLVKACMDVLEGKPGLFEGVYTSIFSGKGVEILGKFSPIFDEEGKVLGGVGIVEDVTTDKLAERELKESRERFEKSFYSSPAAMSIVEKETNKIVDVNDAWCKLLDYEHDAVIGCDRYDFVRLSEETKIRISNELEEKHSIREMEVTFINKSDERVIGLLSVEEYEIGGKPFILNTMMDITERESAIDELLKLSRAVEQSPVSIVITDLEAIIEYVNPKACEISGYLSKELIGKNPKLLSAGTTSPEEYERMYKVINAGGIWHGEFHNKTKTGEDFWESVSISPVINDEGDMTHYIAIKEDITERKRIQRSLRESEERYRSMFSGNPLPMYIIDVETQRFLEVNHATEIEYGYSSAEFLEMCMEDIKMPEMDQIQDLEGKEDLNSQKLNQSKHIRKDGSAVDIELISHTIVSQNGKQLRLVLEKNITEKLNAERALMKAKNLAEASDQLKTSFLNNISHEVRTPLNGIMGGVSLIADPDLTEDDRKDIYDIINQSTDRLIQTITDFMDISLLTSGNMEKYLKNVNLTLLLSKVYQRFHVAATAKGIDFKLNIPENSESSLLETDEELVFKSLCQLVSNAVKFTNKGSITLGYKVNRNELEFFVADTGIGISDDAQIRVFDSFSQEDNSSVRKFEGTGLGLAIVKGIATMLGGKVMLESLKGKGSVFSFIIPAGRLAHIETTVAEVITPIRTEQPVILIAEDDESNFFVLEIVIKKTMGARVIRAVNGIEAIEYCRNNPAITLVLMDIKMPEIDGLEATGIIKKFRPDLPIIAITAYAMTGDEHKALSAGCDDYLAKPISMKALVAKLEAFGMVKKNTTN
ncbi:MAG: PAS domain S-box protein [Bacteroidales bacterium]